LRNDPDLAGIDLDSLDLNELDHADLGDVPVCGRAAPSLGPAAGV
jgi:hypothetical protein